MTRLTIKGLQLIIGVDADGKFGPASRAALDKRLSNRNAPALTVADYSALAGRWGVPVGHIRGVRKVEAPRGPYDDNGRPSILYERHKFAANTVPPGRFNGVNPDISGKAYGPGGYGSFAAQYERFYRAVALDPHAAFAACSWGAFQVLGENAVSLGYAAPHEMAFKLVESEAEHLESFARFVEGNNLVDEFRKCRANDPNSCVDFVSRYNGQAFRRFDYHTKLAKAIAA